MIVSASVAELLPGVSVTPTGAVTVAVLEIETVAEEATVPLATKVALLPVGRLTVVEILPEPEAEAQLPPGWATHVHETPVNVAGNVSVTEAPITSEGPPFVTTIV